MATENHYWFGRKRFGWGWGPRRWQGWLTCLIYALLMLTLPPYVSPQWGKAGVQGLWLALTVVFFAIFFWKLERDGSR